MGTGTESEERRDWTVPVIAPDLPRPEECPGAPIDPPAPDGYLVVHWLDGKVMSYLFSDMGRFGWGPSKNWDGDVSGTTGMMFVHTCDGTVRNEIPLVSVRFVEVVKNSDDYREALRSWQKQYGGSASLLRAVDL